MTLAPTQRSTCINLNCYIHTALETWQWIHSLGAVVDTQHVCLVLRFILCIWWLYLLTCFFLFQTGCLRIKESNSRYCVLPAVRPKPLEGEDCSFPGSTEHLQKGELSWAEVEKTNKQGACSTSTDWQIAGSNWSRHTVGAFIQQNFRGDGKNALPGTLRKSEFCSTPMEAGRGVGSFQDGLFSDFSVYLFHPGDLTSSWESYSDPVLRWIKLRD